MTDDIMVDSGVTEYVRNGCFLFACKFVSRCSFEDLKNEDINELHFFYHNGISYSI